MGSHRGVRRDGDRRRRGACPERVSRRPSSPHVIPVRPTLAAPPERPFLMFINLVPDEAFKRVVIAPLDAPDGPRFVTPLQCDRGTTRARAWPVPDGGHRQAGRRVLRGASLRRALHSTPDIHADGPAQPHARCRPTDAARRSPSSTRALVRRRRVLDAHDHRRHDRRHGDRRARKLEGDP